MQFFKHFGNRMQQLLLNKVFVCNKMQCKYTVNTDIYTSKCVELPYNSYLSCLPRTFKLIAGPRSPKTLVTAQLSSRRWKIFFFDVMQTFNNVQMNGWSSSPNTVQLLSRCWGSFSFRWYEAFQKHSNLWLGRAFPNTAQFYLRF